MFSSNPILSNQNAPPESSHINIPIPAPMPKDAKANSKTIAHLRIKSPISFSIILGFLFIV